MSASESQSIFNHACQSGPSSSSPSNVATAGLSLKQFLTALALITPDLKLLTAHMISALGPQMRAKTGNDPPQVRRWQLMHRNWVNIDVLGGGIMCLEYADNSIEWAAMIHKPYHITHDLPTAIHVERVHYELAE
jgi:hypothetical protein